MNQLLAIVISFACVFVVLWGVALLKKRGWGEEATRKLVHILLSNWILLAIVLFTETWAVCVAPAGFVVLNYISYRRGIFSAIERTENNTPGTVWYAVSLLLLCWAGWSLATPWIAACGILSMGYGDGFAALMGLRQNRHRFPAPLAHKSLEGTLTVAFLTALAVGALCLVYAPSVALRAALCCAAVAAAVELYSLSGIDNLTLPLSVSFVAYLIVMFPATHPYLDGLAIALGVLLPAFYLEALTLSGMHCATLLGTFLYAWGGPLIFGALLLFFVFGSLVSKIGREQKRVPSSLHERQGPRSSVQVIANGLPALLFVAVHHFTGNQFFLLAALASFSVATADTFSSEIGMLSTRTPVSILTGKPVPKGISGGVTPLGFLAASLGSLVIAATALFSFGWAGALVVWLCGMAGSVLDSFMGAVFQAKYRLPCGGLTERPWAEGVPLPLAAGISWMNNDVINFLSILLCGALASALTGFSL
ncbi:MAG TPA: DUF92 domain-containing protein [Clostridiales bacterium]|nr:DUF92 domain-containing protein [Clostridiales bacterium]